MLKQIIECYPDEEILKADGLDEAVIGIDESSMRLIYAEGITIEDKKHELAVEHFEFNVKGAYVGKLTPIWCEDDFEDDFNDDFEDDSEDE